MKCLGYSLDLLKKPSDKLLNDVAKDLYESIKDIENIDEVLQDEPIKQISPLVLNSLAMVLMDANKSVVDADNEIDAPCYYAEVFGLTGWNREYAMNEYVDINGIIDQGMPIEQVIVTEIANRIETLNCSYEVVADYLVKMSNQEYRDLYLLTEAEFKKKYDMNIDLNKLKKYVTYSQKEGRASINAMNAAIEKANEVESVNEEDKEIQMA